MIIYLLINRIKNLFNRCRYISIRDIFLCLVKGLLFYKLLSLIFKFDKWHSFAGLYECCPYKKVVINEINRFKFNVVVEIGCGLGDIIKRINASKKIAIDIDKNVIKAANFLNRRNGNVKFLTGSFETISTLGVNEIDCLVLIYCLHILPREAIRRELNKIVSCIKVNFLFVDEIVPNKLAGFKHYYHDYDSCFQGMFERHLVIKTPENMRKIIIYKRVCP